MVYLADDARDIELPGQAGAELGVNLGGSNYPQEVTH